MTRNDTSDWSDNADDAAADDETVAADGDAVVDEALYLDDAAVDAADEADDDETADDEAPDVLPAPTVSTDADGRAVYDLTGWPRDTLAQLDAMISAVGVDRVWQGSELVVRSMDRPDTDDAIDELILESGAVDELGDEKVRYDISGWPAAHKASLVQSLAVAQIRFRWDRDHNLLVAAADEDEVDDIFEAMPDPDDDDAEVSGIGVQQLLSRAYAAVDVLYKHPNSTANESKLIEAVGQMEWVGVPFGFEPRDWHRLVAEAAMVRDEAERRAALAAGHSLVADEAPAPDDPEPVEGAEEAPDAEPSDDAACAALDDVDDEEFAEMCRSLRGRLIDLV